MGKKGKNMRNKLILVMTLFTLGGCQAAWDKDPTIEGLPPEVEQAPETYMAAMRDSIYIMSENFYDLTEGASETIQFDIQVLQPDIVEVTAEINGLEEVFPGATQQFDPDTGKFTVKWDVPTVFVRGLEHGFSSHILETTVTIRSADGSHNVRSRPVEFRVLRTLDRPEIVSVIHEAGTGTLQLTEGERKSFKVIVRDPNSASERTMVGEPILMVEPGGVISQSSGSHLMSVGAPKQDKDDPELWEFTVTIDTYNRKLTTNSTIFHYNLRAYTPLAMSVEQLRSTVRAGTFRVLSGIGTVEWSAGSSSQMGEVRFWEGAANHYSFSFYEPRGEGRIEMVSLDSKCSAGGANAPTCTCTFQGDNQLCRIHWIPGPEHTQANQDVEHTFNFKAKAIQKTSREESAPKDFRLKIRVSARPPGI